MACHGMRIRACRHRVYDDSAAADDESDVVRREIRNGVSTDVGSTRCGGTDPRESGPSSCRAITLDPAAAGGTDAALRALLATPFDPVAVGAIGVGLIAYGLFSALRARFDRV